MADLPKSFANIDAMQFNVMWKAENVGWLEDVDPSGIAQMSIEKKIGELNFIIIDKIIRGVTGTVKTVIHEVKTARLRKLMPWAGTSGAYLISPSSDYSMYDNAGLLCLHPRGDAGETNDINLLKAFPVVTLPKSAGESAFRSISVEWHFFPDQAALAASDTRIYGYIGAVPAP